MILATKSGWLIAVRVLRETQSAFVVKAIDEKRQRRISKADDNQRLFENTDQALAWQGIDWSEEDA